MCFLPKLATTTVLASLYSYITQQSVLSYSVKRMEIWLTRHKCDVMHESNDSTTRCKAVAVATSVKFLFAFHFLFSIYTSKSY